MQPYGNKKVKGYGSMTGMPDCRCCNGVYAKVGKHWRRNARGLKKAERQKVKKELDKYKKR